MQVMAELAQKYGEDAVQQAYLECLETYGHGFSMDQLSAQAKRVQWREEAQGRRQSKLRSAYLPRGVKQYHGEEEAGPAEIVVPDRVTPEELASLRQQLKNLERDPRGGDPDQADHGWQAVRRRSETT